MLETFFNLAVMSGIGAGWYPETSTGGGGVFVGFVPPLPKGLNWDKKFVPSVSPGAGFLSALKYKKPKNIISAMKRVIIKSIKFLFDINIFNGHQLTNARAPMAG